MTGNKICDTHKWLCAGGKHTAHCNLWPCHKFFYREQLWTLKYFAEFHPLTYLDIDIEGIKTWYVIQHCISECIDIEQKAPSPTLASILPSPPSLPKIQNTSKSKKIWLLDRESDKKLASESTSGRGEITGSQCSSSGQIFTILCLMLY